MKGKKAIASGKDPKVQLKSTVDNYQAKNSITLQIESLPFRAQIPLKLCNGVSNPKSTYDFQFGTSSRSDAGYQFGGCSGEVSGFSASRDACQPDTHHGVFQRQPKGECKGSLVGETLIRCADSDGGGDNDRSVSTNCGLQLLNGTTGNENGGFSAQPDNGTRERPDKGVESGDRMDLEGGGKADASC